MSWAACAASTLANDYLHLLTLREEITDIAMPFNDTEKEVVFLKATTELIDNMVNFEVLKLIGTEPDSEICFNSSTHQKFFNIILVDFLSKSDNRISGESSLYLMALQDICISPNFNQSNTVDKLKQATQEFTDWLEKEVLVEKVWLPSINLEISLNIKRIEFIKICGNISKHNFTRLGAASRELKAIFQRNSHTLSDENALLIFSEFYEWFHVNIFSYHSSAIAEFLNNIRWGIYEYLQPEFHSSIVYEKKDLYCYQYTYPTAVSNSLAKSCYWDLMNEVRSKPYMHKFQVTRYLKMRY